MRKKLSFFIVMCTILSSLALVFPISKVSASSGITWTTVQTNKPTTSQLQGVTWGNSAFIAVGYNGTILKSSDDSSWTLKTSGTTITLNKVIWDGTQYVVVGNSGTILTSNDGELWNTKPSGVTSNLNSIVWNGSQLVAVGSGGTIITSNDGNVWTQRMSVATGNLNGIVWGNNMFVIAGGDGIFTSNDGIGWIKSDTTKLIVQSFGNPIWNGSNFILFGSYGIQASSSDGINWSCVDEVKDVTPKGIVYNGSKYVYVGSNGNIVVSSDGNTWLASSSVTKDTLYDIAWNGSKFVAVGSNGTIIRSDDGLTWLMNYEPSSGNLDDVLYNGGIFIGLGNKNVYVSVDGVSWNSTYVGCNLSSIAYGNNLFVAVGNNGINGIIMTSIDGIHWNVSSSGTISALSEVLWQGSKFIAYNNSGTMLTSPDGITWTATASGLPGPVSKVIYGLNQFVAVGNKSGYMGYIATSPDGLLWTEQVYEGTYELNNITCNDNQYVVVGRTGTILTSPDGVSWTKRTGSSYLDDIRDIVWTGKWFIACGTMEETVVSQDGVTWEYSDKFAGNEFNSIAWGNNKLVVVGSFDTIRYGLEPKSIDSIQPVSVSTVVGTAPVLPTQVTAVYSDNTTANLSVTWDLIPSSQYGQTGTFVVSGTVSGTTLKATANVTVNPATVAVTGVTLDSSTMTLTAGGTTGTLLATVAPSNATNKAVTWTSSNEGVATVINGVVTPVAAGTATITVTTADGNRTATCEVTVNPATVAVTGVTLNSSTMTLTAGGAEGTLTAIVAPTNATNQSFSWSSSNEGVATVVNGVVTPVAAGTATITVSTADGSKTATCVVTVNPATPTTVPVTGVTLDSSTMTLTVGGATGTLTATVLPSNATNKSVIWTSSNENVATVSSAGIVTAVAPGTAIIRATSAENAVVYAESLVSVNNIPITEINVTGINVDKVTASMVEGDTVQLTATVMPTNATNKNVTWTSSNANVARVSSTGLVTAVTPGTATIRATSVANAVYYAESIITVNNKAISEINVTGISVDKATANIVEGDTVQLSATVLPTNATNKNVAWVSSNENVTTVSSTGLVTAVAPGTATIRAISVANAVYYADSTITVSSKTSSVVNVTGISLNISQTSIYTGNTLNLYATISPTDAANKSIVWTSSDENIATVTSSGLVTAVGTGTVKIRATSAENSSIYVECSITVSYKSGGGTGGGYVVSDSKSDEISLNNNTLKTGVVLDKETGSAKSVIGINEINNAFNKVKAGADGIKTLTVELSSAEGANSYIQELPKEILTKDVIEKIVVIKTQIGTVELSSNMLNKSRVSESDKLEILIEKVDNTKLDDKTKDIVGDRTVVELSVIMNGRTIVFDNIHSPVKVSVPYTPSAEEVNVEHITVVYVDDSGNITPVQDGKYNSSTGMVTFTTTHFSKFAIVYVNKTFADLKNFEWAKNQIEVLATKGIINGRSADIFAPEDNISRADFVMLIVKALGLKADYNSNFSDVNSDDYYYSAVATAKALGIIKGDDNKFNPNEDITRQDMMIIISRAMALTNKLNVTVIETKLDKFIDKADVSDYAVDSISKLINDGIVQGNGDKLNPLANTTRAEAAVIIYRLYNK